MHNNILILDNFDSFTHNIYQTVGELCMENTSDFSLIVKRNNEITTDEIQNSKFSHIIISPGPGNPKDNKYFGVCGDVLKTIGQQIPVLGVCLGMQGMASVFGGTIAQATKQMHGKTSAIIHDGNGVFQDIPQHIEAMRYHSLIVERKGLSDNLEITASTGKTLNEGEIMGLRHRKYPIEGIQFHPESYFTEAGERILKNFIHCSAA